MTMDASDRLRDLLGRAGLQASVDSAVEFWGEESAGKYFAGRADLLVAAYRAYAERYPTASSSGSVPRLDVDTLEETLQRNPQKVRAFLQALEETSNVGLLVMVWRIIHGDTIMSIDMRYVERETFELVIRLEDPATGDESCYRSQDNDDAVLLRHIAVMKINDMPIFDGFYALRV